MSSESVGMAYHLHDLPTPSPPVCVLPRWEGAYRVEYRSHSDLGSEPDASLRFHQAELVVTLFDADPDDFPEEMAGCWDDMGFQSEDPSTYPPGMRGTYDGIEVVLAVGMAVVHDALQLELDRTSTFEAYDSHSAELFSTFERLTGSDWVIRHIGGPADGMEVRRALIVEAVWVPQACRGNGFGSMLLADMMCTLGASCDLAAAWVVPFLPGVSGPGRKREWEATAPHARATFERVGFRDVGGDLHMVDLNPETLGIANIVRRGGPTR